MAEGDRTMALKVIYCNVQLVDKNLELSTFFQFWFQISHIGQKVEVR